MEATKKVETPAEEAWDTNEILTRILAENFGGADLHEKRRQAFPDMHLFLASRTRPDPSGMAGGQVSYYKSLGYRVLTGDTKLTGSPDMVLMGIPEEVKQAFRQKKLEETTRDMHRGGQAPVTMRPVMERRETQTVQAAAADALANSGWDGESNIEDNSTLD